MTESLGGSSPPFTLRPALAADIPALAGLLIQLYAAELPGALQGPADGQHSLLRFTLEAQPQAALHHRYVLADTVGRVVATGMLHFPTDPPFERAPTGTVQMATALLGYRAAGRLLLTVARSLPGVYRQRMADAALIHSVVVDERYRGRGLGHTLMDGLEDIARAQGYGWAVLQVLATNQAAQRLYGQRGYAELWRAPWWSALLSWPSAVLRKALA